MRLALFITVGCALTLGACSSDTIVDRVASEYPDQSWRPADSPALSMTDAERAEYIAITASAALADPYPEIDLSTDEWIEYDNPNLRRDMSSAMPRAGREAMIVSMLTSFGPDLSEEEILIALRAGWRVCNEARSGTDFRDAWGAVYMKGFDAEMDAYDIPDEDAAAKEMDRIYLQRAGLINAHLLCPEFEENALKNLEEAD
ncbi:hypothetical protein [Demequina rhizosphaerae]|uniref:hypothetical protein n=1 Tax=Demequina rhizosphaerae TaxID=1638985 RepID=UPI00078604D9|nr:hypothetical protein [Demequina rhizosphaerae]